MKIQHTSNKETKIDKVETGHPVEISVVRQNATGVLVLLFLVLAACSANAQSFIRFTMSQVRITVPVNSINSTTITNAVNLSGGATNANFDVSGLPDGAGYVLTDTNGNALTSTTMDTNLWLTVNTTNIPEGIYNFRLNAGGFDTNGLPVTNSMIFVLQSAHLWNGSLDASNGWSSASSWSGGVPGAADDVIFTDTGAQTNNFSDTSRIPLTNSVVDVNTTIGSLRFAQTGVTNSIATNPPPYFHHVHILAGKTLTISGTNGFSLMRDYLDEQAGFGLMGVNISGEAGSRMIVSNTTANFAMLIANQSLATLNMTNLDNLQIVANQVGIGEYKLFPNYREINNALNVGHDTNTYSGHPRNFAVNVFWPKTNIIQALYTNPDNYTNDYTRSYAFSLMDNEQSGNGSSTTTFFQLGLSNIFLLDSACFYGASSAAGNTGGTRFWPSNGVALFRGTNGTSRMSVFTVSDDGGTNEASSNLKGVVDFAANSGNVNILADRLYLARDREQIGTNQTPNVQADLVVGKGVVDVNTAVFGFQEHIKPDWTQIGGGQPYLNYCQGRLVVTNGGTFRVNGTLTLGYTADTNSPSDASQGGTYGRITIYSNSVVAVNNIVCDGGLNFNDPAGIPVGSGQATPRINEIDINGFGNLIISNSIGGNNFAGSLYPTFANPGLPGLPLDTLSMAPSSILTLFVVPGKTNVYVRNLTSSGIAPGTIKVASLPVLSVFPTNISVIAYSTATPILAADMSAIGGNVQGYIINNTANSTIDLFLTTNAPKTLVWTGNANNNWDLSSFNWVTVPGGVQTNFAMGDIAIFDDSSSVTNINITQVVVPNQSATNNGVTITNSLHIYTFNAAGGSIAGTARIVKQGTNNLIFNAAEAGPITVTAGEVDVSGILGSTTIYDGTVLNVLAGGIVNGLTGTNSPVTVSNGGTINGGVVLQGGSLVNSGTVTVGTGAFTLNNNAVATNNSGATIALGANQSGGATGYEVFEGSTLANFGSITAPGGRLFLNGLYYGPGLFYDPINGPTSSGLGRFIIRDNRNAVVSPGSTPNNSIGDMFIGGRLDLSADNNPANNAGTFLVEVDSINHINDTITATKWNNIGCVWAMTNVNGTFAAGQGFHVLVNANNSSAPNYVDTPTIFPLIQPTIPGPGLQWNLSAIQVWGSVMVTNSAMVWDGNGDQTWNTNGSSGVWKSGNVYGNNQGAIFDDSASGATTVTLTTPVAPAGFNLINSFTNYVTNLDLTITTNIFPIMTNTPSFMPGIVISNTAKDYTFVANAPTNRITGMTGIYKTGSGTLTLLTSNDFSGGVTIDAGTLAFTNGSALGFTAGQREAYSRLMIDSNATIKYFGTNNGTVSRYIAINQNGAIFEVSSNSAELNLSVSTVGSGVLTKTGLGTLVLSQNGDIYGGTIVNAGTVRLTTTAAGTNSITLNNNATLQLTNAFTLTNSINVAGPATAISLQGVSTNLSSGLWIGSGSVTITSTNSARMLVFNNDLSGFSGTLSFGSSVGQFRFNNSTNSNPCTGSAAATFDLGTGSATLYNFNGSNLVYNLGSLAGGPNTTLSGRSTNVEPAGTIYSIGANGNSTTFSGRIVDGLDPSVSIVKVGSGALLLNGNSTYTGSTTVSNGVLGGTGSITSPLTVVAGATLSPGASVGTFTVNNSATLNGTVLMELNRNVSPSSDELVVTGTLNAGGGTLIVTNIGPDIANGTVFTLFNKAANFSPAAITLPATDPSGTKSYNWINNITVDGTITLVSGGFSTNPPAINNSFSTAGGGTLTLSWPTTNIGWLLLSNSVALTSTDQWFLVGGSQSTNLMNMTVDPTKTNVFYRLKLP